MENPPAPAAEAPDGVLNRLSEALGDYPWLYVAIVVLGLLLAAWLAFRLTRLILSRIFAVRLNGPAGAAEVFKTMIRRASYVVPALVIHGGAGLIPDLHETARAVLDSFCTSLIIVAVAGTLSKALDLLDLLYHRRPDAADKPIKGYLQLGKLILFVVALILVVATLVDRDPIILLSGLGAMAAVLMLIFQDTILSVVASIQLGTNNMVHVGDWIEMPSQNADGDVIEIALHTVKVRNWDKTITTLPVRKLITDSFKNWRGMFESGGRRIKRSLYIDQRSVRFLDDAEIGRLEKFVVLNEYLDRKRRELDEWNARLAEQGASPINERRVTNLGTFRAYVEQYLRRHPRVNQEMILLVRQLQPGETGIPLEVYCFTSDTRWVYYESIQADIFDHLLAILPVFDLRVFQNVSDTCGLIAPAPALAPPPEEP